MPTFIGGREIEKSRKYEILISMSQQFQVSKYNKDIYTQTTKGTIDSFLFVFFFLIIQNTVQNFSCLRLTTVIDTTKSWVQNFAKLLFIECLHVPALVLSS